MWVVCLFSCNIYIIRILIWLYSFSYSFHFLNWLRWCFRIHIGFHSHFFNQWMYPAAFVLLALFYNFIKIKISVLRKNLQKTFEHSFRKFLLIVNLSLVAGAVFGNALRIFINISCFWEKKILFKSMPIQFVYYFIGLAVFFPPLSMKREIYFWKF